MIDLSDRIPVAEFYRGVAVHEQPPARIARVVRPEIDEVYAVSDPIRLFQMAKDVRRSPESRLLAAAKVEASFEMAADERRVRPFIDREVLQACTAGLNMRGWRDGRRYASLLDPPGGALREVPLPPDDLDDE